MKPLFEKNIAPRSASRWFARLRAADVSIATDIAFRRWLDRQPQNEEELQRREKIWELLGELENDAETMQLARFTAAQVRDRHRPRTWIRGRWSMAAAAAALAIGYWSLKEPLRQDASSTHEQEYTTRPGEQRHIVLADGSQVELNTATRLRVKFSNKVRLLALYQGEAIFFVQHDANRPFEVVAGKTSTRAVGTIFNILYLDNQAGISVLQGHVRVATSSENPARRQVLLTAGQATTYTQLDGLGPIELADLARISSWQAKRVEFHNATLADAVKDFNRYSTAKILVVNPAITETRVSGVFHFDDMAAFTNALHATFGIRSLTHGETIVLLPPDNALRSMH